MVFSSNIFLFSFLPLFLAIYYLVGARHRSLVILLGSYCFYAWWRVDFLLLFVAVTLWNYGIGFKVNKRSSAKFWLTLGVMGNLSVLGYFKYANFGIDSFNTLITQTGVAPFNISHVILPIGISFYIFQSISYIVDVYRKDTPVTRNFIDFAAFIALFPQLIAGPVLRYKDLADQFVSRTHSWNKFANGAGIFMLGFIKKVFIADSIAPLVDACFASDSPTFAEAWLGAIAYTAQLYFDFSGYSDMAIGLGLMMGFRFMANFNQPYISQSITEFWRRWHISLSSWLRDYLYIPLGGSRKGTFNNYRNLFLTMLLGGLWHGANWTFILWGAWHGAWLAIEKATGMAKYSGFSILRWAFTFFLVVLGWVMFRADTVSAAFTVYNAMFDFSFSGISIDVSQQISRLQLAMLGVAYAVIFVAGFSRFFTRIWQRRFKLITAYAMVPLFALSVLKLSAQSYSPFLYFQF